jgi:TniQ
MPREEMGCKEMLCLETPQIPQRSRLYCIEPIALGTARVESFTGYIIRLANAHSVTVGKLCTREIIPLVGRYQNRKVIKNMGNILAHRGILILTPSLNGISASAREWVSAVEALTMRSDLSMLTSLAWQDVLSSKKLLRRNRAWCPACFEEERNAGRPVYEPLLWCFQVVNACCRHQRLLRQVCHWCNRRSYLLANLAYPGFCFSCRRWLGEPANKNLQPWERLADEDYEWQALVTSMIGELLTAAPSITCRLSGEAISNSINACIERAPGGSSAELARMSKISSATIAYWRKGKSPQLNGLLRVCFQSKISLPSFLTGTIAPKDIGDGSVRESAVPIPTERKPRGISTRMDHAQAEAMLKEALKEFPPPSLEQVLLRLGKRTWPISKHFPRLSKAVIDRHATYRERQKAQRNREIVRALKKALKSKSHPSPAEVARELGCSHHTLKKVSPGLFQSLSNWYVEGREQRWKEVEATLRAMLEESPPVSRLEMGKRTGFSSKRISEKLPELYGQLTQRYLSYFYMNERAMTWGLTDIRDFN